MISHLWHIFYGAVGVVTVILVWGWWSNGYFRRRGVKSPPAYLPIVGHMIPTLTQREHLKDFVEKYYNMYPKERYFGIKQFGRPLTVLRDVELIKQIAIKDFDHFLDHISSLDEGNDRLFGNNLFSLKGQKWRDMRATLSPAFTSSKMRGMFQFIVDCGEQMTKYFTEQMKIPENKVRGLIELEMKDVFTRYTNDVIATCAFGLEVNSFTEKNNQFYVMGKKLSDFSGFTLLKFFISVFVPRFAKAINLQIFSKECADFFRALVWDTIKDREDRGIIRQDMINILIEARKGTLTHESNDDGKEAGFATVEESDVGKTSVKRVWTDDDIVSQALIFFVAGFETSSTLLCFLAHEMAIHPEIQKRLQEEIDEVAASTNGKLTYDCLQKMKYLDMVVSETLRVWPPAAAVDRKCVKSYTLPPPRDGAPEFHLNEGDGVWIPIYGLHHDPRYFKNPEKFDPERFSDENKHNIIPFTFLPFGIGPRNCIGSRFALMEAKAILYNILLKFDIVSTAKTQHPIELKTDTFNMHAKKGFWIGLKPRK